MKMTPSPQALAERFNYDPLTGIITNKKSIKRARAGEEAGKVTPRGYRVIGVDGGQYLAHRIAWTLHYGERIPSSVLIDHRDGNVMNNAIANLRKATHAQNTVNSKATGRNRKGVTLLPNGRWMAQGGPAGSRRFIGRFDTEAEAHAAYAKVMRGLYGDFSRAA